MKKKTKIKIKKRKKKTKTKKTKRNTKTKTIRTKRNKRIKTKRHLRKIPKLKPNSNNSKMNGMIKTY